MKTMTLDELKILFDNRDKEFNNKKTKGEKKMEIKPKDNFVLFFAEGEKKHEKSPDFKGYLNGSNDEKLPIVGWTKEKNGKQYISGVVNEEYKKEF